MQKKVLTFYREQLIIERNLLPTEEYREVFLEERPGLRKEKF
jgi:hypothetical protein